MMTLVHSQAFAGPMQEFMKDYTEFLTEMGHSATALFSQGQATFMQQASEAASNAVEATTDRRATTAFRISHGRAPSQRRSRLNGTGSTPRCGRTLPTCILASRPAQN